MKIAITDYSFPNLDIEEDILRSQGHQIYAWKERRTAAELQHLGPLQNPGDPIVLPRRLRSDAVDYECELAVVIGRECYNVSKADALQYVLGYTCANDVSARDWQLQKGGSQWCRGKSFATFCPLGPWIVTRDEIPDPNSLAIKTVLNGQTMQDWNTNDMIFDVPTLIEFLSGSTRLLPGTVILTGTPHGVGSGKHNRSSRRGGVSMSWKVCAKRLDPSHPLHHLFCLSLCFCLLVTASYGQEPRFVDHSLLIAPEYPCTWPSAPFPRFQITHQRVIGPESAYNVDVLLIDGNTGTQLDVPPHSVARPELNREKSGPLGLAYTDKIEAWQFGGEACVVDVRDLLDQAAKGVSPLVKPEHVERFEKQHRRLRFGDVVLFQSGYSDAYYRPLPEGSRFLADVLDRKAPGFPDPNPDCMEFLASRGVMSLGTDSASMGPLPDLAEPTHYAGLKHGMIWTESATNLGALPPTGAFYCMLGPKHQSAPYSEGRAFSIVGGDLPKRLIDAAKNKRAIDLSPNLAPNLPITSPGIGTGNHRQVYLKVDFLYSEYLDMWHHTHLMDSMVGTHLVPPAYALPQAGEKPAYAPDVRGWLIEYEKRYGPRATSSMTTEQVPLDWTCGPARVIDVRSLVGSTQESTWPASPEITPTYIQTFEKSHGALKPGDVVLFHTGHIDQHFRAQPHDTGVWSEPLKGKAEGWPAPGPDAIDYLKTKGIRCVATDAPDLGGVDPQRALMTYWALGSREMVGVEFLHNVDSIPRDKDPYFLFAALKIRDCHGGPGRAIVLTNDK